MTSSLADAEPAPPDVLATAERAPASDIDPPSYTTTTSSEPLQPSSSHPSNTSTSTSSSDDKGLRKRSGHGRLREVDAGYTGVPVAGDGEPDQGLFGMLAGLFWMWLDFVTMLARPALVALRPLYQPVIDFFTSNNVQRGALTAAVFSVVFSTLVLTSTGFYGMCYYYYVPGRGFGVDVWLQYGTALDERPVLPRAVIDISQYGQRKKSLLTPNQRYDVVVDLRVAESDHNFSLGNFMVKADFLDAEGNVIYSSARPALVRHKSVLLRLMSTVAKSVPLILNFWTEDQLIRIPVVEGYIEPSAPRSTQLAVTLSDPSLQTYSAHLLLITHFTGLRYFMYHYRVSTAIFMISLLVVLESICLFVFWRILVQSFGGIGRELEERDGAPVASFSGADQHYAAGWNPGDDVSSVGTAEDDFDDEEPKI